MNRKTICLLALVAALSSCYEDKGNYDYNFSGMNSIDTLVFSPAAVEMLSGPTIEFTQALTAADTHKRIEVQVGQSLQNNLEQLDFRWIKIYQKDKQTIRDTLTTKGYLDIDLPLDLHEGTFQPSSVMAMMGVGMRIVEKVYDDVMELCTRGHQPRPQE